MSSGGNLPSRASDVRAHLRQRLHDALHRPARERFVADDAGLKESRSGEKARQHPDGRSGVAGIELHGGRLQAVEAAAVDGEFRAAAFDFDAERADAAERRMAIGAGRVV